MGVEATGRRAFAVAATMTIALNYLLNWKWTEQKRRRMRKEIWCWMRKLLRDLMKRKMRKKQRSPVDCVIGWEELCRSG